MNPIYDTIGRGYTATREADPRITKRLIELLDLPKNSAILDVGAGTGNYSCALAEEGYRVTALEPSEVMRAQGKQHPNLSWQEGVSEKLPYADESFDGIIMTLCMHHFTDWGEALRQAARVVGDGPIVILTFDAFADIKFWLFEYFPAFLEKDRAWFPRIQDLQDFCREQLSRRFKVHPFPLPADLIDHFASAGWTRPEIYLNDTYRSGISSFSAVDKDEVNESLRKLEQDLQSGEWDREHGKLRHQETLDTGYIFVKIHDHV